MWPPLYSFSTECIICLEESTLHKINFYTSIYGMKISEKKDIEIGPNLLKIYVPTFGGEALSRMKPINLNPITLPFEFP